MYKKLPPRTGDRAMNKTRSQPSGNLHFNWPETIQLQRSRVGTEIEQCRSGKETFAN